MITFFVGIITLLLEVVGAMTLFGFLAVFFGFQKKSLFSKQVSFLGYKLTLSSTAGRQLTIDITK